MVVVVGEEEAAIASVLAAAAAAELGCCCCCGGASARDCGGSCCCDDDGGGGGGASRPDAGGCCCCRDGGGGGEGGLRAAAAPPLPPLPPPPSPPLPPPLSRPLPPPPPSPPSWRIVLLRVCILAHAPSINASKALDHNSCAFARYARSFALTIASTLTLPNALCSWSFFLCHTTARRLRNLERDVRSYQHCMEEMVVRLSYARAAARASSLRGSGV